MLVNSLKINAIKVQEVIDAFLVDKPYISIFYFTETKVDCINFIPVGLKIFTKQRIPRRGTAKGGGLAIGYIEDSKIIMEEIETNSEDIMVLDGTIHNEKIRIILAYFNCSKELEGSIYQENREMQREIDGFMQIEEYKHLILGSKLEWTF